MKLLAAVSCVFGVFFFSGLHAQSTSANRNATAQKIRTSQLSVMYYTHVQNIGWMDMMSDGQVAGTTGRHLAMEAIKISVKNPPPNAHITYQVHVRGAGWMDWARDGQMAGTTGQGRWIEAIKIRLENCPGFSIQYQVHARGAGWMDWANEGQMAGTTGQARPIEAIKIKIQRSGSTGM